MNQLLSGHTLLNSHRANINSTVSELCESCSEMQDTNHFLFHCQYFRKEREQLENSVGDILNGAGLNEVPYIDQAVLIGGHGGK